MHSNRKRTRRVDDSGLIHAFISIREAKVMRKFLMEILTPSEITDLSLRWKLMKMLKAGVPQRKIAAELGISLCKITRGARILKNPGAVTNRYIQPSESRRPNE
jgi:TrpR family trp operon transcriptional repressor